MREPTHVHRRAKRMRSELSLPEKLLWVRLRRRQQGRPIFRRQHPIGPYVLDFYCARSRLCIEVDGASHSMGDGPQRDERRDTYLRRQGGDVIRIAASSVLDDPEAVTAWILQLAQRQN